MINLPRKLRSLAVLAVALSGVPAVRAQESISPAIRQAVQKASVFVKVSSEGEPRGTGSGFLFRKQEDSAFIVTNQQVVEQSQWERFFGQKIDPEKRELAVVFGSGTLDEKLYDAEVIAEDKGYDLAILKIQAPAAELPEPVQLESDEPLDTAMQIWFFGFPFGSQLANADDNPAITVGSGSVSSLRRHKPTNGIARIQLYAPLNPGNSGGPVVDHQGALIGIAVAPRPEDNNISYAVPAIHLLRLIAGRLGNRQVTLQYDQTKGECAVHIEGQALDPFDRLEKITALQIARDEITSTDILDAQGEEEHWQQVSPVMQATPVAIEDGGKVVVDLVCRGKQGDTHLIQFRFDYGDGTSTYSEPDEFDLETARGGVDVVRPGLSPEGTIPPKPEDFDLNRTEEELEGKPVTKPLPGFEGYTLELPAASLVPELVWGKRSDFFYVAEKGGVVRKIEPFISLEERRVDLEASVADVAMSERGLLVLLEGGKLVVLSPDSLATTATFEIPGGAEIAASPESGYAYVSGDGGDSISVIDLLEPEVKATIRAADLAGKAGEVHSASGELAGFMAPVLSRDGRIFMCLSNATAHRFRVKDDTLIYEAASPPAFPGARTLVLSDDGTYFGAPAKEGNNVIRGAPKLTKGGVYVSRTDNMRPSMALNLGGATESLQVRTAAPATVFAHNRRNHLMLVSPKGAVQKSFVLRDGEATRQILVHESGQIILVLTDQSLVRLEATR